MLNFAAKLIFKLSLVTWIILLLGMSFSSPAIADCKEQGNWVKLVDKMVNEGKSMPTQYGEYRVLSDVTSTDRSSERTANYISAVVYTVEDKIYVDRVESVFEDWKLDDENNFRVDQWLFRLTAEGELDSQSRSILKIKSNGSVLGREYPTTSPQEMHKKWTDILALWCAKL